MKMQIVTILIVIIALIGLSGITAAQSGGDKKKCEDGNKAIAGNTLSVIGHTSET
jgi:hypothetical protein